MIIKQKFYNNDRWPKSLSLVKKKIIWQELTDIIENTKKLPNLKFGSDYVIITREDLEKVAKIPDVPKKHPNPYHNFIDKLQGQFPDPYPEMHFDARNYLSYVVDFIIYKYE